MSEVSARPQSRYAAKSRTPSGKLIVIGIIGLLLISGAYIFVQMNRVSTSSEVTASAAGWAREEGREDDVFIFTLDVTREDPAKDSYCIIYALDYNHAEVGRRNVVVPGSKEKTVRMDVPIETRAKAVAGNVYGCSTNFPEFLDTDTK
ncbi:DUF4307 domain-containing protein [Corynebacterium sp. H113]|uniref:DUF4307 domain-containing protein n=1 Tax=Corynebacterium sp. H113 TaxID=3133419 RepID=UPI0030B0E1DB